MRKLFVVMLLPLTISACGGQERPQAVADLSVIPAREAPPVDTSRPLPDPMLPDLQCLQTTGLLCPGAGSSSAPGSTTTVPPRI